MMRKMVVFLVVLILSLAPLGVAYGITFGWPDEEDHPYVGLMVADVDGVPTWRCSGTLIAPTVFLTAGHCTAPDADGVPVRARFYLDPTIIYDPVLDDYTNETYYMGTPVVNPAYDWSALPHHQDVAAVIMDEPVPGITEFGELPTLDLMDEVGSVTHPGRARTDQSMALLRAGAASGAAARPHPTATGRRR